MAHNKASEYLNLIKHTVIVESSASSTKLILNAVSCTFRKYSGKQIEFVYQGNVYGAVYSTEQLNDKTIQHYLTIEDGLIVIPDASEILIFESFATQKDNQLMSKQDIIENITGIPSDVKSVDRNIIKSKYGHSGLITDIDKSKLDNISLIITEANPITIEDFFSSLLYFRINDKLTNSPKIIQLFNNTSYLNIELTFDLDTLNPIFNVINSSIPDLESFSVRFFQITEIETGDLFLSLEIKRNNDSSDYTLRYSTNDLTDVGINIIQTLGSTQVIPLPEAEDVIVIDNYLVGFNKFDKKTLVNSQELIENSSLNEDVVAVGVNDSLGIPDGTVYSKGTTLTNFAKQLLRKIIHPTYLAPTASLNLSVATVLEIGSTHDIIKTVSFNQRDGGPVNNVEFFIDSISVANGIDLVHTTLTYEIPSIDNILFQSITSYDDGPIKNNNVGEPDALGQILANTIQSSITIRGDFRVYAGGNADTPGTLNDAFIKGNNSVGTRYNTQTSNFTLNVENSKYVWIALPAGRTLDTGNTKNPGTNEAVFAGINPVSITVLSANNPAYPNNYNVYVLETAIAWSAGTVFNVVLN